MCRTVTQRLSWKGLSLSMSAHFGDVSFPFCVTRRNYLVLMKHHGDAIEWMDTGLMVLNEKTQVNIKPQCTPNTYLEADRLVATSILPTLPCDAVTLMDTDVTYCSGWWDVQAAQGAKALLTCQGRSGRMPDFSLCISPGMQRKFTCSLWVFWSSNCKFSCCHNRDARDGNMVWPTQQVLQINLWAQISLELTPLTIMYLWAESPD